VLSGTQGRIARLFSVTGLNRRFQSYDTVGEAMAALPGSGGP
jgi:anti-anti-sigma regulatory factor